PGRSWSGARLHHGLAAEGARRLLSTPSRAVGRAWLGVGADAAASRAFADFAGVHSGRFPPEAQIVQVPCVYLFQHAGGAGPLCHRGASGRARRVARMPAARGHTAGRENPATRARIEDVAAAAGVSIKTVWRVFNREPNVREES